jgi:molybdenum cofactor biosynthesis protein B
VSESTREHRRAAAKSLALAVVTVSDTRTEENDESGRLIVSLAEGIGHQVIDRRIIRDEPEPMSRLLRQYFGQADLDAVLMTGGTGISPRDQTFETVSALLTKPLPGYGELFRMLSYAEIGPSCLLSRAVGGLMGKLVILVMPGSRAAVELAMTKIILPELPHIVHEAKKGLVVPDQA